MCSGPPGRGSTPCVWRATQPEGGPPQPARKCVEGWGWSWIMRPEGHFFQSGRWSFWLRILQPGAEAAPW